MGRSFRIQGYPFSNLALWLVIPRMKFSVGEVVFSFGVRFDQMRPTLAFLFLAVGSSSFMVNLLFKGGERFFLVLYKVAKQTQLKPYTIFVFCYIIIGKWPILSENGMILTDYDLVLEFLGQ